MGFERFSEVGVPPHGLPELIFLKPFQKIPLAPPSAAPLGRFSPREIPLAEDGRECDSWKIGKSNLQNGQSQGTWPFGPSDRTNLEFSTLLRSGNHEQNQNSSLCVLVLPAELQHLPEKQAIVFFLPQSVDQMGGSTDKSLEIQSCRLLSEFKHHFRQL